MGLKYYDPRGNEVTFPEHIIRNVKILGKPKDEIFDDLSVVIEKPMMMFEKSTHPAERYYLRAVGWSTIVLICAAKSLDGYRVTQVEWDPSLERIADIYDHAVRLM